MDKKNAVLLLFLAVVACNLPISYQSTFEQSVATKVSLAQTSTAITSFLLTATLNANPQTVTPPESQPTFTATPPSENPKDKLGMPAWKDALNNGANWDLKSGSKVLGDTTIKAENGLLIMSRSVAYGGKTWWLNYLKLQNFYLESKFITQNCTTDDQYGLVFRAANYFDGFAYYYIVTCDGNFTLMRWDANGAAFLFNWEKAEPLNPGPDQVNDLGVWCQGNLIRLYANGKLIKEVLDLALPNSGHFGLFIDARQTPGFTIKMDEIAYWNIQ